MDASLIEQDHDGLDVPNFHDGMADTTGQHQIGGGIDHGVLAGSHDMAAAATAAQDYHHHHHQHQHNATVMSTGEPAPMLIDPSIDDMPRVHLSSAPPQDGPINLVSGIDGMNTIPTSLPEQQQQQQHQQHQPPLPQARGHVTPRPSGARSGPTRKMKYREYTEDNLKLAVTAILEKGMSLRKASSAYGVPKTTLAERVADRRPPLVAKAKAVVPTPTFTAGGVGVSVGAGGPASGISGPTKSAAPVIITRRREDIPAANTGMNASFTAGDDHSIDPEIAAASNALPHHAPPLAGLDPSYVQPHIPTPSTRYTWTEAEMLQAIEAVQSGLTTVADAAKRFGVPPSNLNSRARGREPKHLKGEMSRLTLRQESLIAEWARCQAALGLPASKDDVWEMAERVLRKQDAVSNGGNNKGKGAGKRAAEGGGAGEGDGVKRLGKQWIVHWQRRWPHVEVLDWRDAEASRLKRKRKWADAEGGDNPHGDNAPPQGGVELDVIPGGGGVDIPHNHGNDDDHDDDNGDEADASMMGVISEQGDILSRTHEAQHGQGQHDIQEDIHLEPQHEQPQSQSQPQQQQQNDIIQHQQQQQQHPHGQQDTDPDMLSVQDELQHQLEQEVAGQPLMGL